MWRRQKRLLLAVLAGGVCFFPGAGPVVAQTGAAAVPDAARKAVARRQEKMQAASERLARGDRLLADGDAAGACAEYRAAFQGSPDFAMGQPLQGEAFAKYQAAARQYCDRLAQQGRLDEARKVLEDLFSDARDSGITPRAVEESTKRLMADLRNPDIYNPALTAAHVDRVKEVEKGLRLADGAYRIGDFDEASKQYAVVLGLDPTNQAARRGLQMVDQHVNTGYLAEARDHTRSKMLNAVSKGWESPVPRFGLKDNLPSEEMRAQPAEAGSLQEKLRTIIVPEVEFAETPLREALTFLANRSRQLDPEGKGVNIVLRAKDEGAGSRPVTITLRGAPLGTVIEYVGRMVGMDHRVDDFAVALVPAGDLSTTELILKNYRVPPGFLSEGALVMKGDAFAGNADPFAAAGDKPQTQTLQPKLGAKEFLEKNGVLFPPGAAAQFNAQTSTLMVRNTQDQLDLVEAMVQSSFGNVTKMLRVAVKAIDIGQDDLQELGFDWLLGSFGATDRIQMAGGNGGVLTNGLRSGDFAIDKESIDAVMAQTQGLGSESNWATGVLSATGTLTNPQFATILRAVDQHKAIDGLLTSSVVVRSGQTATVKNVREFIYPTDYEPPQIPDSVGISNNTILIGPGVVPMMAPITPANPEAFETREVGAKMEVEGIINPDGYSVELTLTPEIVEFQGFVNYGSPITFGNSVVPNQILMPVFATKRVTVKVDVYDGHTLVIGGLVDDRVQRVNDKVPGLGDAPFLGSFFRQKSESNQRRALLFFVTPTIIDPAGSPVREEEKAKVTAPVKGKP